MSSIFSRRSLFSRFAAAAPAVALASALPVLVADAHVEADSRGPSARALDVAYENGRADGYLRGHDVGSASASYRADLQIAQNASEAYGDGYGDGRRDQAEIDQMVNTPTAVVVGALYDFMGWLATMETPITVSSAHEVHPLLDSFEAWAKDRGIDIRHADVGGWEYRLSGEMLLHKPAYAKADGSLYDAFTGNAMPNSMEPGPLASL